MACPDQRALFGGRSNPRAYAPSSVFSAKPNGYAAAPGTGPEGQTCGQCGHCRQRTVHQRHFYKCALAMHAWSRDRSTDILLKSPACSRFTAGTPKTTTIQTTKESD